jgi:hypothetical protein
MSRAFEKTSDLLSFHSNGADVPQRYPDIRVDMMQNQYRVIYPLRICVLRLT